MNKKITIGLVLLIILIGFGGNYLLSNSNSDGKKNGRPSASKMLENMSTQKVFNQTVQQHIEISGRVHAYNKIEVFSEVTGVLKSTGKTFREGRYFKKGQNLIAIDDAVYRNNMLAEKSQLLNELTRLIPDLTIDYPENISTWEAYLNRFDIEKSLEPLPKTQSARERNYLAARNIYTRYYAVKSMEAMLDKYHIKAPFNGVVTESYINPGSLVRQGQKIGEFTNTSVYELNAIAGLDQLQYLTVGQEVTLFSDDLNETFSGKIRRINQKISPETQSVNVYIRTAHPKLKDGMFIRGKVSHKIDNAVEIRRSILINNQNLYVLTDSLVNLKKVNVVSFNGDHAIIKGLPDGTIVITRTFDGIKDGLDLRLRVSEETKPVQSTISLSSVNQ